MMNEYIIPQPSIRSICIYEQVKHTPFNLKSTFDVCVYMWICTCLQYDDFTIDLNEYIQNLTAEDIEMFSLRLQKKTGVSWLTKVKMKLIRLLMGWKKGM